MSTFSRTPLKFRFLTTFGLGLMKPASGTWGSLPPPMLAAALMAAGLGPVESPWVYHGVLAAVLVVFSLACILYGDHAEARFGKKDPGQVVADETAAQCIPLMFLPAAAISPWWHAGAMLMLAFLAFRIFDIIKPWPARGIQAAPGGWGILLDDLVAGVYAMVVVQAVARLAFWIGRGAGVRLCTGFIPALYAQDMPCALVAIAFFFPRLVMILLVIFGNYLGDAYKTTLWPLLGFFLMPYTTLAYAWAWHAGSGSVSGFGLFIVIIAVLVDLGTIGGGGRATQTVVIARRK